jgi:cobalt-zinc-cadmium efflux system outer membrane protein
MRSHVCSFFVLLGGCASASLSTDVTRVRELSHTEASPNVEQQVEPLTSDQIADLLKHPLDADAAVRIAVLNNRELRAQLRDMGVERGQLMQAGVVANPLVEVEFLPERNSSVALRIEYEITSLILAPVRAKAAANELESARYRAAGAIVQTGFQVRAAFYALQSAQMRLQIAKRSLDAFAASRDAAEALLKAGNLRELDASSHVLAHERAQVTMNKLELEVANAFEHVHRLLSLDGTHTRWTVASPLPLAPTSLLIVDKLETTALDASLEMNEIRQRLEGLARQAGYTALSGWIPTIDVDVHALVGDPEAVNPSAAPVRLGVGVAVRLPIFDQQRGTKRVIEAQRDALLERYHGLAINLRSHIRETRNNLGSAHSRSLQYQQTLLPTQAKVFEHTLRQYNAMQLGVFQLLQARREQLDVELEHVETLAEYWTARAAMEALLAGKFVSMAGAQ